MSLRAVLHTLLVKFLTQIIQIFQHQTVELFAQIGGWRKMSPLSRENVFRVRLRIHPAAAPPSPAACCGACRRSDGVPQVSRLSIGVPMVASFGRCHALSSRRLGFHLHFNFRLRLRLHVHLRSLEPLATRPFHSYQPQAGLEGHEISIRS